MAVVLIDIVVLVFRLSYYSSLPSTGFSWYIYVKYMYSINLSNLISEKMNLRLSQSQNKAEHIDS